VRHAGYGHRGFTLIELIMVLTIVSVLAAVALPRFASISADARVDKVRAAAGATRSAAVMGRALMLARGYPDNFTGIAASPALVVEGLTLSFVNGYPSAQVIAELAGLASPVPGSSGYIVQAAAGGMRTVQADPQRPGCAFAYVEAAPGGTPDIQVTASPSTCE
jgi:MSHA pilin protein MshA